MMKTPKLILLSFALVFLPACEEDSSDPATAPGPAGAYRYSAYNENGTLAVTGWLTIEYEDSSQIQGEWHFIEVGDAARMGPQVGDGELVGSFREGQVWIDLNPQYRDNNVVLSGTIVGSTYQGTWAWISFVGLTSQGSFKAVR